jgi:hypothetical protein
MPIVITDTVIGTGTASAGAVTINKIYGRVITESYTTLAGGSETLQINNTFASVGDVVLTNVYGAPGAGSPVISSVSCIGGAIILIIHNVHLSAAFSGTYVVNYVIFKA